MSARVPYPLTWHMCRIIVDYLGLVVSTCILRPDLSNHVCSPCFRTSTSVKTQKAVNQSRGHWLLNDTLNSTISMNLKFKDEIESVIFNNIMEEDRNVIYELSCLASNIKKEVVYVLDSFHSFSKKYEERKPHNVFSLMLDPRF